MVVMVSALKIAASRSTLSVVALSKAGNHVASLVASEAAATPKLLHRAPWVVQVASALQEVASVVASEVGSMVDAVVSGAAAEAVVVSRTEDMAVAEEVVSDMEEAPLQAVMEAEEGSAETADQTVVMEPRHLMLQLDQEVLGLDSRDHHPEVSVLGDTVRARQIATDLLLEAQVDTAEGHHTTTVGRPADTEVVIAVMVTVVAIAIVEYIAQHRAEATWSQYAHVSHARTAGIATETQEITTWV